MNILSRHQERFSEHDIETQYCCPLIISKGVVTGMKVAGNMEEHTNFTLSHAHFARRDPIRPRIPTPTLKP